MVDRRSSKAVDPDGNGGDEYPLGREVAAVPDAVDVVPRRGDDRRRLHQHAHPLEPGIELDGVVGLDRPLLGREPVDLLDAVLGVAAVTAHVELAAPAGRARFGVRTAHHADDEVALGEPTVVRCLTDAPERLVPQDQPLAPWWRPAVPAGGDLAVRAAHAESEAVYE